MNIITPKIVLPHKISKKEAAANIAKDTVFGALDSGGKAAFGTALAKIGVKGLKGGGGFAIAACTVEIGKDAMRLMGNKVDGEEFLKSAANKVANAGCGWGGAQGGAAVGFFFGGPIGGAIGGAIGGIVGGMGASLLFESLN